MRVNPLLLFSVVATGSIPSARAVPPVAATEVKAYAPNQSRVHLSWKDNATDETSYYIDRWNPTTMAWDGIGGVPADSEVFRLAAPSTAEQEVRYRVAPFKTGENEANLNWVEATVQKPSGALDLYLDPNDPEDPDDSVEVPEGWEAQVGVSFSHQIEVFNGTPDTFTATGYQTIPASVPIQFNSNTGVLTGTVSQPGVYRIFIGVTFDGGKAFEQVRFLRVLPDASTPEVNTPAYTLPSQNIGVEGFVDIRSMFKDPKRPKGAIFDTSQGYFTLALFDSATPKTVKNFLGYVNRGDYNATYVHRVAQNFVVQGGGGGPASSTAAPTLWRPVAKQAPVPNEPGISNTRGTIAMAKLGSNPDSATNEWFLSLSLGVPDSNVPPVIRYNPEILDRQNGGFTAFGRLVGSSSQSVVDSFNSLQRANYSALITGVTNMSLTEVPVNDATAPATPGANSLVRVYSVNECPPVVISLLGNSNPSVVTAGMAGMLLYVKSLGPTGTANLTLRATNLDGNSVNYILPITIEDLAGPGVSLTKLRGARPLGSLLVKGRASDNVGLGRWRYRVNRGKWKNGGVLSGTSAVIKKKMSGFRSGKNAIEIEVYDKKGNSSGILKQTFTLG
ncbi:MAG: peptidylprolyl isomerase [Verrucomicrobiales bacterium]|nr:peptidylprolyl isomerase [Verrucomicrobiales bacterium]